MKKRRHIVALLLAAGVAAAFIGIRELEWKWGTLGQQGPFQGEPYKGTLQGEPTSQAKVAPGVIAEIFAAPETQASVLRVTGTNSSWAIILGGKPTSSSDHFPIRRARIRGVRRWKTGYRILYKAEWDVSGAESGTVYLNPDMTLNHFTMR